MKLIKGTLAFMFWAPIAAFYGLWVNSSINEHLHQKLFYTTKIMSFNNFSGQELIDINTNFFGIPILTLNMEFFAPLLQEGFIYGLIFYGFLIMHNLSGYKLLDPAGDSVTHESRPLRATMAFHCKHVMEYMFWHLVFMSAFYGLMGMFFCECPTPFLRSLIGLFVGFIIFMSVVHEKTGSNCFLSPLAPKRFDTVLLSLIWVEYNYPGKSIEFIKILPLFYALWFYKVGQYRERHAQIFFVSNLPPAKGDECYQQYKEYKRQSSLVFNIVKYVKNKVHNYQNNVHKIG